MEDQLPTVAIVSHYDSFGAAPVNSNMYTLLNKKLSLILCFFLYRICHLAEILMHRVLLRYWNLFGYFPA